MQNNLRFQQPEAVAQRPYVSFMNVVLPSPERTLEKR